MAELEADVLVIGSGPGGEGAAMKAAKEGLTVVVAERYQQVGGGATHWGTIPSKALRHVVRQYIEFRSSPLFASALEARFPTFPELLKHAERVIAKQVDLRRSFYRRNGVEVVAGHARFADEHEAWVTNEHGAVTKVRFRNAVIATGSRPHRPDDVAFEHPRVHDSDSILSLEEPPRTICIYGAGVVGCEYASIFRNLEVKVTLVNSRSQLLSFLDDEIIDAVSYHLRDQGVVIRHDERYERIDPDDDGVVLHLKSGKKTKADVLLWAAGRVGNVADLGLERIGITVSERGHIEVDTDYRTRAQPHIYAVGDVVGWPSLASAAYDQGRFAASNMLHGGQERRLVEAIPAGIYTIPEISCIGRTERELTEAGVPYEVGQAKFRDLARAQIAGVTVGMLKLLFHRETRELLGVHCFGYQAAEILHIGQAIMAQKAPANTIDYFVDTTFNYPTMAEAYRVAALNGLNRLF